MATTGPKEDYEKRYTLAELTDLLPSLQQYSHRGGDGWSNGSWATVNDMAVNGWQEGLDRSMSIIDSALETVEQTVDMPRWEVEWDYVGGEVDVGRYLSGIRECMIEPDPVQVSLVGKVVTLDIGVCCSAAISADNIVKRGTACVALAMALQRCDHAVEIWISYDQVAPNGKTLSLKTLIKAANDSIDPALLAYWLAHPTVQRLVMFGLCDADVRQVPREWYSAPNRYRVGGAVETLPDGTIYLPGNESHVDLDTERFVTDHLKKLGIVE